jgi:putative FmdB family regulatory protein
MPIYEYECVDCRERIERLQRADDPPPAACEACGGAMRRVISAPAFQFKGSGWYVTDYGGRKSSDAAPAEKADGGSSKEAAKGADGDSSKASDKGSKASKAGATDAASSD